jgi:LacI family transcriptional regulator
MSSTRVTIQDVADRLGLSKFSVSRALSGKPGVAETTRSRVLQAARAMGYQGHAETTHVAGQILFVRSEIDPVSSELWLNIMHGAETEAERLGYSVVPRQARYLATTSNLDPSIVGLILAVPRPADIAEIAARTGVPVVCASYVEPLVRFDHVVGADWESGVAVARMLTGLGHRHAVYVHGSSLPLGRHERFRGFRDGMLETPGAVVEDLIYDEATGFRRPFLAYLRQGGTPTALFCGHDGIAVSAVSELLQMGLRIPDDVSIVGYSDFACATQISPHLTTVRTPQVEMGAAMVRCIADRLAMPENRSKAPVRIALAAEIVRRASAGPVGNPPWQKLISSLSTAA